MWKCVGQAAGQVAKHKTLRTVHHISCDSCCYQSSSKTSLQVASCMQGVLDDFSVYNNAPCRRTAFATDIRSSLPRDGSVYLSQSYGVINPKPAVSALSQDRQPIRETALYPDAIYSPHRPRSASATRSAMSHAFNNVQPIRRQALILLQVQNPTFTTSPRSQHATPHHVHP